MTHSYGVGDRVRLNSGGPEMLVVDLLGSMAVVVSWPDSNGYVHERTFPNQCVQVCTPRERSVTS